MRRDNKVYSQKMYWCMKENTNINSELLYYIQYSNSKTDSKKPSKLSGKGS